jgi:lipoyl(octanoyl) transferase
MHPAPDAAPGDEVVLRRPGRVDYSVAFRGMQDFTDARTPETPDEIWLLEHPPVFTMGLKGRGGARTHIHGIPVVYSDRGGDMTYHGPGQLVAYILMDLNRRGWGAKRLVNAMEQSVINLLAVSQIQAERRAGAPGVYVAGAKIASLGLRVRRGASYHGIALNLDLDLTPFSYIDPCGYPAQPVTRLIDLGINRDMALAGQDWLEQLQSELGYTGFVTPSESRLPGLLVE